MDLPMYDGQNPDDWIYRMEKCFSVNQIPESERLERALACMTSCAVTWLRITQDREDLRDWRDFKDKLKKRFRPTRGGIAVAQMLKLKQTGCVDEYREQFEELSAEGPHVTNDVLEDMFLNGLRKRLKEQVVRYLPMGMDDIVDMAKTIEEQEAGRNSYSRVLQRTSSATVLNQTNRASYSISPKRNEITPARKSFDTNRDYKGAGGSSVAKQSVQIPCRYCGERYFSGHKCMNQRFKCMEVDEEEDFDYTEEEGSKDQEEQKRPVEYKNWLSFLCNPW